MHIRTIRPATATVALVIQYACELYDRIVQKDGLAPVEKLYGGEIRRTDQLPDIFLSSRRTP